MGSNRSRYSRIRELPNETNKQKSDDIKGYNFCHGPYILRELFVHIMFPHLVVNQYW